MRARTILIASAAAVLAACSDGDNGNVAQIDQDAQIDQNAESGATAGAAAVPLTAADGTVIGEVTRSGNAFQVTARGLPPGVHGIHLHDAGLCEGPGFDSAGPHWNPTTAQHGRENPQGPHLGDLPNLEVGADGRASASFAAQDGLADANGFALVIHADPDDNRTDPSGNSGARIACAAITG